MNQCNNTIYDVCVVGGGYSGLVLSLLCDRAGLLVCLIEQNDQLGRKILSTGNGRCNFTNAYMDNSCFYSKSDLHLNIDYKNSIDFVRSLGIVEKSVDGYFYPYTNQAKTIRDGLDIAIRNSSVEVYTSTKIKKTFKSNGLYFAATGEKEFVSKNLVIATGGLAAPSLGSNGDGFQFAKQFNIKVTDTVPGLVGLKSNDRLLKNMAGVRAQGVVHFENYSCGGEIQLNKDGISGYPVMCISRHIAYQLRANNSVNVYLDFIPYYTNIQLKEEIYKRVTCLNATASECLNGLCNDKIIGAILSRNNISLENNLDINDKKTLNRIVDDLKNFVVKIEDTKGFEYAQVTAGGVDLNSLNTETMMCNKSDLEGLYFIGEVCDVDGICGGYNLEWARYSATCAANSIINNK